MSSVPFTASIRPGVRSSINTVNVRNGPGTNFGVVFEADTGLNNLLVQSVESDSQGARFGSKVYQWFELAFPDDTIGWVRDDLIDITGDGTQFGYGVVTGKAFALELTRTEQDTKRVNRTIPTTTTTSPSSSEVREISSSITDIVVRQAFAITAGFEGSGYASYQTYDRGLISYGRFQFTLAAGSLAKVINRFIELAPNDRIATTLQRTYLERVNDRDTSLRDDRRFKLLLQRAADIAEMQAAQDDIAFSQYWEVVDNLSLRPRRIQLPLTRAMAFDIGIQHGPRHDIFATAERQMGITSKAPITNEKEFARRSAQIRRNILYRIADAQGLAGVKVRADFWLNLIQNNDWDLQGDANGNVTILGRSVQVRNP